MISLEVEDYCQNCKDFEPYCNVLESDNFDGSACVSTIVQCRRKDICHDIYCYIAREYVTRAYAEINEEYSK